MKRSALKVHYPYEGKFMDDIVQCGNSLALLGYYLIHRGKETGDPAFTKALMEVTDGLVQVVASLQIRNQILGDEIHAAGAKMLTVGAGKLVATKQVYIQ
jgi:hypothetical protein